MTHEKIQTEIYYIDLTHTPYMSKLWGEGLLLVWAARRRELSIGWPEYINFTEYSRIYI